MSFSSTIRLRIPPNLRASVLGAVNRLEINFDPRVSVQRVKRYQFNFWKETVPYALLTFLALFSLAVMAHPLWFKLFLITAYTTLVLIPFSSQFVLPATPIFSWLLFYYSCQFIPAAYRPHIWVSVLPTLESVLYGANISDILTRYTNPALDILAWIPYGILHFALPFIVAACLFVFGPPGVVKFWGTAFGYLNLFGVIIQVLFPCAPPWYELREGLVPANYGMRGSPGGLARIDAIFHSNGYTVTFSGAPVPFGAFPSLHAGCSTMEALFLSHFFPQYTPFYWSYIFVLYWSTMYLTHHYLIDLVAGGSLAVVCFYYFLPAEFKFINAPTPTSPSLSMDAESGLPKSLNANGHPNGYGGWEGDDADEEGYELPGRP
ncbi:hypothetical protein P7C70_g3888, partial [Phenoliferia sp. Uapishka_3]